MQIHSLFSKLLNLKLATQAESPDPVVFFNSEMVADLGEVNMADENTQEAYAQVTVR
jgi:hypothetical protein